MKLPAPAMPPRSRGQRWLVPAAVAALLLAILLPLGYWFAPTVIRLATNKGVLVIETDDKSVEVLISGQDARIIDANTKREIELKAGDYEIEIREKPDGVRLFTRRFTITRAGKEIVNVHLELAKQERPEPPRPEVRRDSLLDRLDPRTIPLEERFEGQPPELFAILGSHHDALGSAIDWLAFAPDGRRLAWCGHDKTVHLWDLDKGREERCWQQRNQVAWLAYSPDGRALLVGGPHQQTRLLDTDTGKELQHFGGPDDVMFAGAIAGDGRRVLTIRRDYHAGPTTLILWDAETGTALRQCKHPRYASSLAVAPTGLQVLTTSEDKRLRLWNVLEEQVVWSFTAPEAGMCNCVALSPDGTLAASDNGSGDGVLLWNVARDGLEQRSEYKGHSREKWLRSLAFAPDSQTLASADGDGRLLLWDRASGKRLREWRWRSGIVCVVFAPDGRHLAAANEDGTIYILRLR